MSSKIKSKPSKPGAKVSAGSTASVAAIDDIFAKPAAKASSSALPAKSDDEKKKKKKKKHSEGVSASVRDSKQPESAADVAPVIVVDGADPSSSSAPTQNPDAGEGKKKKRRRVELDEEELAFRDARGDATRKHQANDAFAADELCFRTEDRGGIFDFQGG